MQDYVTLSQQFIIREKLNKKLPDKTVYIILRIPSHNNFKLPFYVKQNCLMLDVYIIMEQIRLDFKRLFYH